MVLKTARGNSCLYLRGLCVQPEHLLPICRIFGVSIAHLVVFLLDSGAYVAQDMVLYGAYWWKKHQMLSKRTLKGYARGSSLGFPGASEAMAPTETQCAREEEGRGGS